MSIKIYFAWRVNTVRLNGFIDSYRDFMMDSVVDRLVETMPKVKAELVGDPPDYDKEDREEFVTAWEQRRRFDRLMNMAEDLAKLSDQYSFSGLDLECGLNIWIRGRYAYCYPICNLFGRNLGGWEPPKFARDFSAKEWWQRKNIWKKLCLGPDDSRNGHSSRLMYHAVIDLQARNTTMVKERLWSRVAKKVGVSDRMFDTTLSERWERLRRWKAEALGDEVSDSPTDL